MLKKILSLVALGSLFVSSALADDFLAKVTQGALSDNSKGVKVLSLDEMKEVKGGYLVTFSSNGVDEVCAIARVTMNGDAAGYNFGNLKGDEIIYDSNGNFDSSKSGVCGINVTSCFLFNDTKKPYWQNQKRLQDIIQAGGDPVLYSIGYTVKRNIGVSSLGKKFVYFTYGVGIYDNTKKTFYKTNSINLSNNIVIKELRDNYKESMEYALGGWYAK